VLWEEERKTVYFTINSRQKSRQKSLFHGEAVLISLKISTWQGALVSQKMATRGHLVDEFRFKKIFAATCEQ
jgi:hypothetical protein